MKHLEKQGIVSTDGSTIINRPQQEITGALVPKGGTMKYLLITSSDDDRDMALYYDRRSVSLTIRRSCGCESAAAALRVETVRVRAEAAG